MGLGDALKVENHSVDKPAKATVCFLALTVFYLMFLF
jgi:hypothetical protein